MNKRISSALVFKNTRELRHGKPSEPPKSFYAMQSFVPLRPAFFRYEFANVHSSDSIFGSSVSMFSLLN